MRSRQSQGRSRRHASVDWRTALRTLEQGNARFATGAASAADTQERRLALLETQAPLAAVLGCADSRVPPEIIFDARLGDLFVARVAGHLLDEAIAASLGFAVETLSVPLVVVLGHEGCAAVRAALAPEDSPTWLRPVTARVAVAAALAEARRPGGLFPALGFGPLAGCSRSHRALRALRPLTGGLGSIILPLFTCRIMFSVQNHAGGLPVDRENCRMRPPAKGPVDHERADRERLPNAPAMTDPAAGQPAAREATVPLLDTARPADANVAESVTSAAQGGNRPAGYGRLVPAVEQATRILYHLAATPADDANLTEICRAVGIHKSKGYAILNTLRSAGLVVRNEPAKTYALGPGVLTLSRALLDRIGLAPAAEPHLAELAQATGATALLGLITTGQVFIVARQEAPAAMGVTVRVGHRYPLTWGAHGKAIVAFLPPARREAVLAEEPLFFYGDAEKPPADRDLRAELAEVRRQGFALDLGGVQAGINAVSAPVLNSRGEPAAVLVLVGTFPPGFAPEHGRRVAATAREMTARLAPFLEAIS